ncbi:hypothetical protein [Halovivax gelatinilyticus]|uniref:hypothetical protein n=1 Tax=Halovivax gelatinilyticus TaxID=2961597 RepID=UPI0020CA5160|nr:hypothetical protein [Halovivax gelatinilyticus]
MEGTIAASGLRDVIAPATALVNEAVLTASYEEMQLQALSADKNAVVTTTVAIDEFDAYSAETSAIGVRVDALDAYLKLVDPASPVQIRTPPHSDSIRVIAPDLVVNSDGIDGKNIRQQTGWTDRQDSFRFSCRSNARSLRRSLEAADLCGPSITINADRDDSVEFTATGEADDMRCRVTGDVITEHPEPPVKPTYPVEKLREMHQSLYTRTDFLTFEVNIEGVLTMSGKHVETSAITRFALAPLSSDS